MEVDTTVAFPYMSDVQSAGILVDPQQPTIDETGMWIWPGPEGTKRKPVEGNFAIHLHVIEGFEREVVATASTNGSSDDGDIKNNNYGEYSESADLEDESRSDDENLSAGFVPQNAAILAALVATIAAVL